MTSWMPFASLTSMQDPAHHDDELQKRISLLEEYIAHLHQVPHQHEGARKRAEKADPTHVRHSYYMTLDENLASDHWEAFHHVYQIHCPKIILTNTTRDVCWWHRMPLAVF